MENNIITCNSAYKAKQAQDVGAIAVILYFVENYPYLFPTDKSWYNLPRGSITDLTIPVVFTSFKDAYFLSTISGSVSFTAFTYDGDAPEEHMAYFSSPGPTYPDYRIKPDVSAPGTYIRSASKVTECDSSDDSSSTAILSGTSMATPVVAGSVALVRQYLQDGFTNGGVVANTTISNPSAALLDGYYQRSAKYERYG